MSGKDSPVGRAVSTTARSSTSSSSFNNVDVNTSTTTASSSVPPLPPRGDEALLNAANTFVHTQSGFYSPADPSVFSDDFVFRGPIIGPLNKDDYLSTMNTFCIYKAFPDIQPNPWGFSVDPTNPRKVWFLVRNTGTFSGKDGLHLGNGIRVPCNGRSVRGCPETFSITFEDSSTKIKAVTVGYVADRFEGNTHGKGAAVGLFHAVGLGMAGNLVDVGFVQWLNNNVLNSPAKTVSRKEDVPEWWPYEERGTEGM